jgi:PhzF family phenazine biosynthesis protein
MQQKIYIVDAFTDKAFAGNPAAVYVMTEPLPDERMQLIAREFNLSETAFLLPEGEGYKLRWFTPTTEVELCGHATMASAHILYETGRITKDKVVRFYTLSGELRAKYIDGSIELNFPEEAPQETEMPDYLAESLDIENWKYVGKNRFDYIIELGNEQDIRSLTPNFSLLAQIPARGIIVTAAGSSGNYDFISRFFCPNVGINEDPVTGSAHCCLVPYWQRKLGKEKMRAYQASERGGEMEVYTKEGRVFMQGKAVTVIESLLLR